MTAMNECKLYHMIKDQLIKDHPWGPGPEGDYVEKNPTANQTITGEFDLKLVGNVSFNSTLLHPGRIELTDLLDEEGVTYRLTHYGGGFYLARGNAATNTETTIFSLSADGADFSKLGVTVDKIITTEIANDTEPEIDVVNTSVLKPAFRVQGDYEFTPFEQPNKVTNGEQYAIFQCKTYVPNPDDYNDDDVNDYQVVPKKWIVDHISGGQGYVTEDDLADAIDGVIDYVDTNYVKEAVLSSTYATLQYVQANYLTILEAQSMYATKSDLSGYVPYSVYTPAVEAVEYALELQEARYPGSGHIPHVLFGFGTTQDVDDPTDPDYLKRFATHKYVLDHLDDYVPYSVYTPAITGINEHLSLLDIRFPACGIIPIVAYGANTDQDTDPETDPNTMTKFATHQYVLDHSGGEGSYLSLDHDSLETVTGPTGFVSSQTYTPDLDIVPTLKIDNKLIWPASQTTYHNKISFKSAIPVHKASSGLDSHTFIKIESENNESQGYMNHPYTISLRELSNINQFEAFDLFTTTFDMPETYAAPIYATLTGLEWPPVQGFLGYPIFWQHDDHPYGGMPGDSKSNVWIAKGIGYNQSSMQHFNAAYIVSNFKHGTDVTALTALQISANNLNPCVQAIFSKGGSTPIWKPIVTMNTAYSASPDMEDDSYGVNVAMSKPVRTVYRRKVFQLSGDYFLTEGTWLQYDDFTERAQSIHETMLSDEDVKMLKEKNVTIDEFSEYRKLSPVEHKRLEFYMAQLNSENRVTAEA